jgi:tRNA pseudouridine55 synthase
VVAEVRRRLSQKRVGHTGTLDPMATGLLPVCVGEACKLVPFLTDCDKAYEAEVVFGLRTSTGDAEGEQIERRDASQLAEAAVQDAARAFVGTIDQVPPMYSAIRVEGQRLHKLAREGFEVERAARKIEVRALSLRRLDGGTMPRYRLEITCGKGTYVRVIAEDLGAALGVGAHLSALRRTAVAGFRVADATSLDALSSDTPRVGLAEALCHVPSRTLDEVGARRVRSGQERWLLGLADPPPPGRSALLDVGGQLVAVIFRIGEKIRFERVFVDNPPSRKANTPDHKDD